jgi:ribosomal protein S18 acetylase RimI-like enzyme
MSDMLVKLYELKDDWGFIAEQEELGITIRKPIGPEKQLVVDWVRETFSDAWASETDRAISNVPISNFIAIQDGKLIGFTCYDATALGFFGPIGVLESCRGRGTGKALLLACLLDMKLKGYGYAIIGSVGPSEFYSKSVGAVEIPDSSPGLWKTWLRRDIDRGVAPA